MKTENILKKWAKGEHLSDYTLIKEKKGSGYLYTIIAPDGREVKCRLSTRNYVAATCNGRYFFCRRDRIGKGSHGNYIKDYKDILAELMVEKTKSETRTASQEYRDVISERIANVERHLKELTTIAYLLPCESNNNQKHQCNEK